MSVEADSSPPTRFESLLSTPSSSSDDDSEQPPTPQNEVAPVVREEKNGENRYITTYPGARYVIPSDSEEKQRLIRQHFLMKNLFGSNLLAPAKFTDGDEVLEIGTGTGIWVLDYASELSLNTKIHFHGTDIESRLFPSPPHPPDVEFSIQSVTNLPASWGDKYTVVHQRLLIAGLTSENWGRGIKEIYRVLKPGGWVELCEHTSNWIGGEDYVAFWTGLAEFYDSIGLVGHCSKFLKSWLVEAGFVDVHFVEEVANTGAWAGEEGKKHRDNLTSVFRALKPAIVRAGGMGGKSDKEMDEFIERVKVDMDREGTSMGWVRCFARKPE